jgi:hypothetical protein
MMYAVEMTSCVKIHLPSFMKIGTGVQVILRFCFRNMKGCYGGITEGWDL